MKVAIDISPLSSGHRVRGVGFYLVHLKEALEKYFPENIYSYFTNSKEIPKDSDIVHYPYFDPFFPVPFLKNYKTVVTVHDLTPLMFPQHFPTGIKGKIRWYINKKKLMIVNGIITDSENSKKDIVKLTGISDRKITKVYLAAGEEFKKTKVKEKGLLIKKKYNLPERFVMYVGDVTWNKNVPRIIEATTSVKIPLVLVGKALAEKEFDKKNAWNKDKLQVEQLTYNNSLVTSLGFVPVEDLTVLYNLATLCIMPSLYEGFGLPILEAMQSGCPVVTSKNGSIPEVAGDEGALFVDAEDVSDIAKGIEKVFGDDKLKKRLSEKGLEQAKKFSWKSTASQTLSAYQKVLQAL